MNIKIMDLIFTLQQTYKSLILSSLYLQVHLLNEDTRGATIEAVISRMKTVQKQRDDQLAGGSLRFVAVSATIPNVEDVSRRLDNIVNDGAHRL